MKQLGNHTWLFKLIIIVRIKNVIEDGWHLHTSEIAAVYATDNSLSFCTMYYVFMDFGILIIKNNSS